ncbi:hypothetical protein [Flavobacterium limi]|uniref:Uncharacterized protein n=1 Tax=Flavobacterium limi TaxID=2045105 RepID=A0ABQ1UMX9_9FLAO|nr:hypothetical protein [Flavobacterium limi]GGF22945.1 hypothetical protein GCM10011518_35240 [Flavobacterium limi]
MAEVKQEVVEISSTDNKITEETNFYINQLEVIEALLVTGKEEKKNIQFILFLTKILN